MARYLPRTCPKCGSYLGVVLLRFGWKSRETPVNGLCALCGYSFKWILIDGGIEADLHSYNRACAQCHHPDEWRESRTELCPRVQHLASWERLSLMQL